MMMALLARAHFASTLAVDFATVLLAPRYFVLAKKVTPQSFGIC
jgi:hypothetical protein